MIRGTRKGKNKISPKDWAKKTTCSIECKAKRYKITSLQEDNPNWKGGKPKCISCGLKTSQYGIIKCRGCYVKLNRDKNHPNYKNGLHKQKYPSEFNEKLKLAIRKRDNFICQLCNKKEKEEIKELGRVLCVNHIDFNKSNCKPNNLNTLCLRCNIKINYNRDMWTNYFKQNESSRH